MQRLSNTRSSSFTIMIVEDNIPYRKAICGILGTAFPFAHLIEAGTVEAAMRPGLAPRPDLVFVDIRLPDGNGLNLVRALRRQPGNPAFCIMTIFDVPEYRSAGLHCGATHFLAKAASTNADVIATVEVVMAQRTLLAGTNAGTRQLPERVLSTAQP